MLCWPGVILKQQISTGTRRSEAFAVTEAKTWGWKEFGEGVQKDFQLASKTVWTVGGSGGDSRERPSLCSAKADNC